MPTELQLRKFVAPEIIFGDGARYLAGRYALNIGAKKVLLVTDPGLLATGWPQQVLKCLDEVDIPYVVFAGVSPNPRDEEVMAGAEIYGNERCNAIIAVGGGSAIDCAKGIGIVGTNTRHIRHFEGVDQVKRPIPPLVCIPTTGGSSADVSQFAIIRDMSTKVKMAIVSKAVVPDVALIDPSTLTTMPSYLSACTGLDALTHAIEAYVSNASSPLTDIHAIAAIKLISQYLEESIKKPEDIVLRSKVMLGSMEAGLAFSNAILGAVHAMAHSLGGLLDMAHGECNAILLEPVIDFNYSSASERYVGVAEAMGIEQQGMTSNEVKRALLCEIIRLRKAVRVDNRLSNIGIGRSDIPQLARDAIKDVCMATNPRTPTQNEIEGIYERAL
ncbi:MAG: alcohol dehydrogenase [Firmicutes bacterium HGW-Firmicutes-15]|nr:MAG: alcohol dehydrogenase [Firmicutes bacterium HGW-Firmicutes-15]